jgi:GAF domain-containing protein
MQGDLSHEQETALLAVMAKITSISDLSTLLKVVVKELPSVVGCVGCLVYLHHKYVPEYTGILVRKGMEFTEDDMALKFSNFIVLAATNLESKMPLIGKAFFGSEEGVTGWVHKNGRPLRIDNLLDDAELKSISPDLFWANEYNDGDELYSSEDKRPLLAVPLVLDNESIGTLKFHATIDKQSFSDVSQEIATIASQIISGVLRQTMRIAEQGQIISRLIETSNKDAPLDVIADVTKSMKAMLNCSRTEFFIKSDNRETMQLLTRNGEHLLEENRIEFKKGQSLVGWVFKTGLPLIIPNIREFITGINMNDEFLEIFSSSGEINNEDRVLKYEENTKHFADTSRLQMISFLAAPIKSRDQEVLGVLCAYRSIPIRASYPFERSQLILATSFASTIALVLENARQRRLNDLFTKLGNLTQTNQIFEEVTKQIPTLVSSSGCSIFTTVVKHGVTYLELTHTSRRDLLQGNDQVPEIQYRLKESKTGMCGHYQLPLLVNHYGNGNSSLKKLDREEQRIESDHANDIISDLFDNFGRRVGIFQMRNDAEKLPITDRVAIRKFAKEIIFLPSGMASSKLEKYHMGTHFETWSYVAVPICDAGKLLGVITLARSIPGTPFARSEITLLKSIAGRLASVMNNLRFLKHREQLVMSLAHEINTPLTGILADSQNLYEETAGNAELQKIAHHNLGQILRLQMQSSAIMSVLSEQNSARQFSKNSIIIPLKEACELFESEASSKGCDILGPTPRGSGLFPTIEMSLFDLTIAFKNFVHNAVKYSFRPPTDMDTQRTINVWGEWPTYSDQYYSVFIQNYGVGIMPYEIERRLIFEPYYRGEKASDRRRTGAGFGLAHARMVIEDMHHGHINVSCVHIGGDAYLTTFKIDLPLKQLTYRGG